MFRFLSFALALTLSAALASGSDLRQSPQNLRAEKLQVLKWLNGRTLECKNAGGDLRLRLSSVENNHQLSLVAASSYGDADGTPGNTEIAQLSAGELLMIYVTGPDADEGGAVVSINTDYANRDGETNANAILYSGVAGDDATNASEALKCTLKK